MVAPIPKWIEDGLRIGGVNQGFFAYNYTPNQFPAARADLAKLYAQGARATRILLSMETLEDAAKTGKLRADRWLEILGYAKEAKRAGLVPVIDMHNTGMLKPGTGDWTDDYMGQLRDPVVAARFLKLMVAIAKALYVDDEIRNAYVLTSANEPIFVGGDYGDESIWYDFQKKMIPAMRAVCPDGVFTVVANDWNGIESTVWNLWDDMPFWDARMIIDCHFYEPLEGFTHAASGKAKSYPGIIPTWRTKMEKWPANKKWNSVELERIISQLAAKRDDDIRLGKPEKMIIFSEFGPNKFVDMDSRIKYYIDVVTIFKKFRFGWLAYTYADNDWDMRDERIMKAIFSPSVVLPPPIDPPPVDPPPVDPPDTDTSHVTLTQAKTLIGEMLAEYDARGLTNTEVRNLFEQLFTTKEKSLEDSILTRLAEDIKPSNND